MTNFFAIFVVSNTVTLIMAVKQFQGLFKHRKIALLGEKIATIKEKNFSLVWEKVFSLISDFPARIMVAKL